MHSGVARREKKVYHAPVPNGPEDYILLHVFWKRGERQKGIVSRVPVMPLCMEKSAILKTRPKSIWNRQKRCGIF